MLATAFFRYLLVCHPHVDIHKKISFRVSMGIVVIIILAIIGGTVDILFRRRDALQTSSCLDFYSKHPVNPIQKTRTLMSHGGCADVVF